MFRALGKRLNNNGTVKTKTQINIIKVRRAYYLFFL